MPMDFRTLLTPWLSTPADEPDPPGPKADGSRDGEVKPKPKK